MNRQGALLQTTVLTGRRPVGKQQTPQYVLIITVQKPHYHSVVVPHTSHCCCYTSSDRLPSCGVFLHYLCLLLCNDDADLLSERQLLISFCCRCRCQPITHSLHRELVIDSQHYITISNK